MVCGVLLVIVGGICKGMRLCGGIGVEFCMMMMLWNSFLIWVVVLGLMSVCLLIIL